MIRIHRGNHFQVAATHAAHDNRYIAARPSTQQGGPNQGLGSDILVVYGRAQVLLHLQIIRLSVPNENHVLLLECPYSSRRGQDNGTHAKFTHLDM